MNWRARYDSVLLAMVHQLLRWAGRGDDENDVIDRRPVGWSAPESGPPADWLERVRRGAPGLLNALRLPADAAPSSSDRTAELSTLADLATRGVHSPAVPPPRSPARREQRVADPGWTAAAGARAAHRSSNPEEAVPHHDRIQERLGPAPPTFAGHEGQARIQSQEQSTDPSPIQSHTRSLGRPRTQSQERSQERRRGPLGTAAHASPDRDRPPSPEATRTTDTDRSHHRGHPDYSDHRDHPNRLNASSTDAAAERATPASSSHHEDDTPEYNAPTEPRQYTFTARDARIHAPLDLRRPATTELAPAAADVAPAPVPLSEAGQYSASPPGSPATAPMSRAISRSRTGMQDGMQLTWPASPNSREWRTAEATGARENWPADHVRYPVVSDAATAHPWPELPAEPTVDAERLAADLLRENERWRRSRLEQEGMPWSA